MRNADRTVLRTLSIALAATGFIVACSTSNDAAPGQDDGGVVGDLPPGTLPDGAIPPAPPKPCATNEECPSGVCNLATKLCEAATCTDGVKNGTESDIDCGSACAKCETSKACTVGGDCASGVCVDKGTGKACQAPTNTDGVKNGAETGIDCGGTANPKCADGQGCKVRGDCTSDYCKANVCSAISPADGIQNGTETDVDCGGVGNARCGDNLKCLLAEDCKSDVCTGAICQPPSPTDGKKNGTETDVDCGGDAAPACTGGKVCLVGGDCVSLGCNYQFKCAEGRSCTRRYGGDTCGLDGLGGLGGAGTEKWEDCCMKAPVTPLTNPGLGVPVLLDKYQVTAGRMRAFMESVGYDVRGFVQQARIDGKIPVVPGNAAGRTVLEPEWDMYLPTSFAGNTNADEIADTNQGSAVIQPGIYTSVRNHLGGLIFRNNSQSSTGCYVGSSGGGTHAFRFPDGMQDGPAPSHDQDLYDTKSMQCIDYLVAQAFCVWDGGRLNTLQEWQAAWGPTTAMPWSAETTRSPAQPPDRCDAVTGECLTQGDKTYWGCRFPWATDANHPQCGLTWDTGTKTIEYAAYRYLYEYPKLIGNDYIVFITAPGRTLGRGPAGHADIIGGNFSLTSTVNFPAAYDDTPFTATHRWTGSGSWEVHGYSRNGGGTTMLLNKYGKLGLRCAYPM